VNADAIVFDLYGTLVDYASLRTRIYLLTPNASQFVETWRAKQLLYTFTATLTGRYVDFDELTGYALDYAAAQYNVNLDPETRAALVDAWSELPPFPEVPGVLAQLRAAGPRLAVLSNGSPPALARAVEAARLGSLLDAVLSVDAVRRYKPSPEVYQLAVEHFGLAPERIAFVSSNGWDATGAAEFGFQVYWCNRGRRPAETFGAKPLRTLDALGELLDV
jgi:2-haloacid dehalogenase